mmetsp:Transcript_6920/g.22265  ORF Transcript_6920/g.22265 Transcript_6920/m.22265 type:complete len:242 (+) Transcript_6920:122-847(+)
MGVAITGRHGRQGGEAVRDHESDRLDLAAYRENLRAQRLGQRQRRKRAAVGTVRRAVPHARRQRKKEHREHVELGRQRSELRGAPHGSLNSRKRRSRAKLRQHLIHLAAVALGHLVDAEALDVVGEVREEVALLHDLHHGLHQVSLAGGWARQTLLERIDEQHPVVGAAAVVQHKVERGLHRRLVKEEPAATAVAPRVHLGHRIEQGRDGEPVRRVLESGGVKHQGHVALGVVAGHRAKVP